LTLRRFFLSRCQTEARREAMKVVMADLYLDDTKA
jgi:hypothetical protein